MRTRTMMVMTGLMALTLAACGGSTDAPETSVASLSGETEESDGSSATTAPDFEEAQVAFAECMREEGIPMPDPDEDGGFGVQARSGAGDDGDEENTEEGAVGDISDADTVTVNGVEVDPEDFEAAQQACQHLMDEAIASREIDPEQQAEMQDEMLAFAQCMRDQGIPWPDPEFDENGGVRMQMSEDIDAESDEVQAAMEECGGGERPRPIIGGPDDE